MTSEPKLFGVGLILSGLSFNAGIGSFSTSNSAIDVLAGKQSSSLAQMTSYSIGATLDPEFTWVYLGLRYEAFLSDLNSGGTSSLRLNRFTLIAGHHFHLGQFFLGPMASVGFLHDLQLSINSPQGTALQYSAFSTSGYSLGIDLGYQFKMLELLSEVSYLNLPLGGFEQNPNFSANLSGFVMRLSLGFFF